MTPRPYNVARRQEASDERREQLIVAARDLLDSEGDEPFSVEAVARRAGVSRMTVYNQFGSKAGLLEALFDRLAERGNFRGMAEIFAQNNPRKALDDLIALFGAFWTLNRTAHRRLRAAAIDDEELAAAIDARNVRRRRGLLVLTQRIRAKQARSADATDDEIVRALYMLTSFDTFDTLAGSERTPQDVVPMVQRLARAVFAAPR